MSALDTVLLVLFPYVAVVVFVVGFVYRYRHGGFTISSLSSQLLEGRSLFWGTIPFHVGIVALFFGHLVAFLLPQAVLAWNARPLRLMVLETTGLIFGITTLVGLLALMHRRLTNPRIRAVTTRADVGVEILLLGQIVLGVWIALGYRWGSSWFASDLTPYLWSLARLAPETGAAFAMPWAVKLHIVGAFAILVLIPFTRLAHVLVTPLDYLARPYQLVIWNWNPRALRDPGLGWRPTLSRAARLPAEPVPAAGRPPAVQHLPPEVVEHLRKTAAAGQPDRGEESGEPRELTGPGSR
jgi:nitrate reductase gamma subunit